jgi:hypothetical protein
MQVRAAECGLFSSFGELGLRDPIVEKLRASSMITIMASNTPNACMHGTNCSPRCWLQTNGRTGYLFDSTCFDGACFVFHSYSLVHLKLLWVAYKLDVNVLTNSWSSLFVQIQLSWCAFFAAVPIFLNNDQVLLLMFTLKCRSFGFSSFLDTSELLQHCIFTPGVVHHPSCNTRTELICFSNFIIEMSTDNCVIAK